MLYGNSWRECPEIRTGCMGGAKQIWVKVIEDKAAKDIQAESCWETPTGSQDGL